jgi:bifunctional non-homologous end joining protein LigD
MALRRSRLVHRRRWHHRLADYNRAAPGNGRDKGGAILSDRVRVTHPDKVLFPDDGITKAELVDYYETVASKMLPLVGGRPVTMQRFPRGIGEKGFLQKQIGDYFPDWIERVTAPNRRTRNATVRDEVTYVVCRTPDDLAYLANQACVTPHVWLSRATDLYHPDQMVFDLDPGTPDREVLLSAAAMLHELLDELGLPSFLKSSGSRGLHIVVPLIPSAETDEVKAFSMAVSEALAARDPGNLTTEARIADRHDRLYLDIGRNGYAQHMAAPYAVRALPGAPVSVPLDWSELDGFDPRGHTLRTIQDRLDGPDPWAGIEQAASAIEPARARLAGLPAGRHGLD